MQFWALHTIPGPLRTEQYARAVHASLLPPPDQDEADRAVAVLRQEQRRLTATAEPRPTFLLDESVLRRAVGGHHVMDKQSEHPARCAG